MKKERTQRLPKTWEALLYTILVMGVIIGGILLKLGTHMSITLGSAAAVIVALILGCKWKDIQDAIVRSISKVGVSLLILLMVGMLVGTWVKGGTIATLATYGLQLINPTFFLVITFVLCALTSLATGTSFGTIASVGLACLGVGVGFGVPEPIIVGAIVSGAFFGDKLSPLSDTTNVAAASVETPVFSHIKSMLYTTLPAALICIVVYQIINFGYTKGSADMVVVNEVVTTLSANYTISFLTLISPLFVIVASAKKMPTLIVLFLGMVISAITGMILQGISIMDVFTSAISGGALNTGVAIVDKLTAKGGASGLYSTVALICLTTIMGGALEAGHVVSTLVKAMTRKVKSIMGITIATMITNYVMIGAASSSLVAMLITGKAYAPAYRKLRYSPNVLSRTLEDTGTLAMPLIPWTVAGVYVTGTLGVSYAYIPFCFLCFLCPIIAIILVAINKEKLGMFKMTPEEIAEAEAEEAKEAELAKHAEAV